MKIKQRILIGVLMAVLGIAIMIPIFSSNKKALADSGTSDPGMFNYNIDLLQSCYYNNQGTTQYFYSRYVLSSSSTSSVNVLNNTLFCKLSTSVQVNDTSTASFDFNSNNFKYFYVVDSTNSTLDSSYPMSTDGLRVDGMYVNTIGIDTTRTRYYRISNGSTWPLSSFLHFLVKIDVKNFFTYNFEKCLVSSRFNGTDTEVTYKFVPFQEEIDSSIGVGKESYLTLTLLSPHVSYYGIYFLTNYASASYQDGYTTGFSAGQNTMNQSTYDSGYSVGYSAGLQNGYYEGVASQSNNTFGGLVTSVVEAPITYVRAMFNYNLLGINLLDFFASLLTFCVILKVIKLILGNR